MAFRLRSASEYYLVAASALETRVDLFCITDGRLKRIAGLDAQVNADKWHSLSALAQEDHFTISFDGQRLFTAVDRSLHATGYAAFWTDEDNVTRFDELAIMPRP